MLTELSIKDFAIIDRISVTFNEGMTVLTGETGAGKSIIIDAVQLLAGGRGSVEYVRHGSEKTEIEGLFSLDSEKHPIYEVGETYGIEIEDNMIVLHRTITNEGRSICRINGKLVTLGVLREFGKRLIDIHTQHETQSLMDSDYHIELLDMYDPEKLSESKEAYTSLYNEYLILQKKYNDLSENEQELTHRLDLLEFQMKELDEAQLTPNEDDVLEEERNQLANYENIYMAAQIAYNALSGERDGVGALNKAQLALQKNRDYDTFIAEKADKLTNHYFIIEELSFELRDFIDGLHYDSNRLDEIESRLHEIDRLKRKYGPTVNDMLEYMAEIEKELDQIKNKDSHLEKIKKKKDKVAQDAFLQAKQLHELRKQSAAALTKEIQSELKGLYLENTIFSVSFEPEDLSSYTEYTNDLPNLRPNGIDQVRFLVSTNPGEPLRELSRVASGGELSRIMLVLKKIFSKHQGVTSVIFDEIDTGVSGRVAQAMGDKIWQISNESQVLCITHIPQVAAMADIHMLIDKYGEDNRVATTIIELSKKETVEELSRMMTGTELTDTALDHAQNLLNLAETYKEEL